MKRILLLFLFSLVLSCQLSAQGNPQLMIDSLLNILKTSDDDSNKVNTLNELSKYLGWRIGNYDTAIYFALSAIKISEKIHYKKGEASALNNFGQVYFHQGKTPEALKSHFEALKIREHIKDNYGMAGSLNNIGNIYVLLKNYPEALKYLNAAVVINTNINNKPWLTINLNNIGNIYLQTGKYNEGLNSFSRSLKIAEGIDDVYSVAMALSGLANTYHVLENYSEALKYYTLSLQKYNELGDKYWIAISNINIGSTYLKLLNPALAKDWFKKGLIIGEEIDAKDCLQNVYKGLAEADSSLGYFSSAYENYKRFIYYRESMFNEENTKKLAQTELKHEFEKKEAVTKANQEKKDIIQRTIRNYITVGLAGALLFLVVVYQQKNKVKREKKNVEKEKLRSEELLLNILPLKVAEELKKNGSADAQLIDEVTVLFTDFKGFTQLSEKLSPKELVAEIHECFSAFDNIMEKYGVEKIKTIGDAYMAAGGIPIANKTHAEDVVNAALEIQSFMQEHKAKKIAANELYFEIRIGINTGPVVAGIVGIKKFAYDIWGDTVNTASRMESSGEVGKVNISGTTYEFIKDKFTCVHRGKVQAKGKGEIDMYFVN
ncbi:MAG TPA: adenylate/guanylate cyclase domain-containing protein [Bacteroidia bacterium]|nr:adenylate/guanylate cyclase domain-containing protein [Bacteroidia bacterium]